MTAVKFFSLANSMLLAYCHAADPEFFFTRGGGSELKVGGGTLINRNLDKQGGNVVYL